MSSDLTFPQIKLSWNADITKTGDYVRTVTSFRHWIKSDGSSLFPVEKGRYHLYVSLACPWAHRTLICRKLKGLEDVITVNVVDWHLSEGGWRFSPDKPDCTEDTINSFQYLSQVYRLANPAYDKRITVPVLFDKIQKTIVNNESSEIIRMFNSELSGLSATPEQQDLDIYPQHLRDEINELNNWIYPNINNGVYRAGFARSQEAYDKAVVEVFEALDKVENILRKRRYLTGNQITEADIRLFTTLVRFDSVYSLHFKCNIRRIIDYPNIWGYLRDLYQIPEIGSTVNMEHIKKHYMVSHTSINPLGIVARGPEIDFTSPHGRDALSA